MVLSTKSQSLEIDLLNGGAISHLTLSSNGRARSIIKPQKGYYYESSLLFPFPNRLANGKYSFEGKQYEFPLNDFGRPNALHGIISDKPFNVLDQLENSVMLGYSYTGGLSYYPFPFDIRVTYTLLPSQLKIDVEIENKGGSSLPCGFGWHPYFNIEEGFEQVQLQLKSIDKICVDDNLIPTGRTTPYKTLEENYQLDNLKLDDCFLFLNPDRTHSTKLFFPDSSIVEVWQDSQNPFVQIFTPEDNKSIAIEPMTCGINALNTGAGLKVLKSNETWSFQFGVKLS